jgi:hypothetical protein
MVSYPMKRCSGEDRVNRMIVAEELRVEGQQIALNEPNSRSPRPKTPACLVQHRGRCVEGYDPPIRYPAQQLLCDSPCTAACIKNDLRPS